MSFTLKAQHLSFQHLSVKEGLSSFTLACNTFDKNGFLWVGSNDGLNKFDGYGVTQYFKETHPQLLANEIGYLYCDSRNRIWICTNLGLVMLDENRIMKTIMIHDTLKKVDVNICFETQGLGIIVATNKGTFLLKDGETTWKPYTWFNTIFNKNNTRAVSFLHKDTAIIVAGGEKVVVLDFKHQKILLEYKLDNVFAASFINKHEILCASNRNWNLQRIDITTGKILQSYTGILNQQQEIIQTGIFHMQLASDKNIYISTVRNGLLKFKPEKNTFENYMHYPMDENTISNNSPRWIAVDKNGYLAISSNRGLSLTNINYSMMKVIPYFTSNVSKLIDEDVTDIVEIDNKKIWVTTTEHLLSTDITTKQTTIIRDIRKEFTQATNYPMPVSLEKSSNGNIWVAFSGEGISIYKNTGVLLKKLDTTNGLPVKNLRVIKKLDDGSMLVGGERRLFKINSTNYAIDTFANDIPLQKIAHKRIIDILPNGNEVWIAVSPNGGAYCYNFITKKIKEYSLKNGLPSDRIYAIQKDKLNNIYIAGYGGLSVLSTDGKIKNFDKSNGLAGTRIENLLADDSGFVWFTNNTNITKYNPYNHSFSYFDEHNGLNVLSYTIGSAHKLTTGDLVFGNKQGIVIFNPSEMKEYGAPLKLFIHYTKDGKDFIPTSDNNKIVFEHNEGKLNFSISTSDLLSNQKILYSYKMTGLDTGWSTPTLNRNIIYNLRSGKYNFTARATYNGKDWIVISNPIKIEVKFPFWQKAWFIILAALLVCLTAFLVYKRRIKNINKRAAIQQQITELEAKALRAQMNPHFIFNSLNAIQELIVTENMEEGYRYLSSFSKLLRMVLNYSEKNFITLSNEIEVLKLYLSLEALRFRQSFSYDIIVDENIEADIVQLPSLLLQPYVENAVWHGLRHKHGEKVLTISITEKDDQLEIIIEDNGVGREKSEAIKSQKLGAEKFESKGTLLATQRIEILNQQYAGTATTKTIDLKDSAGNAIGTRVIITLPIIQQNK
jgi:ligand-binding sensor domain-containing protein/anti-sigma regulatory factor (Ser/Thr protein kinase)